MLIIRFFRKCRCRHQACIAAQLVQRVHQTSARNLTTRHLYSEISQKSSTSLPSNLIQKPNNSSQSNLSEKTNNSSTFNLSQNYNNSPPSNLSQKTNNSSQFNLSQKSNTSLSSNLSEKANNCSPSNLSQKTNNSSFLSSNSQKSNSTSSSNKSSFSRPSSPLPHPSSDCKGSHINGAIPIPNGKFRNPEDVFSLMLSESPSGREVPQGIKVSCLSLTTKQMYLDKHVAGEHFMPMIVELGQTRHLVKRTTTF